MASAFQHPTADTPRSGAWSLDRQDSSNSLQRINSQLNVPQRRPDAPKFPRVPQTSQERRDASLTEQASDAYRPATEEKEKTVLYLAYGSNLCKETFRGVRGIRPLSQINVLVPSLRLTFDLPGIPYTEPCFANTAERDPEADSKNSAVGNAGYHKDRWHKGLVGCVYEVTQADYVHIIATEGGGSAYNDILVDCYPLTDSDIVPTKPVTTAFKAHTLFAPVTDSKDAHLTDRFSRPDPSYAQPSARYLKLITDGATELALPAEYQLYLNDIRTYTITSKRQAMGKALFVSIWLPFITFIMSLNGKFQDENGRAPKWLATLSGLIFLSMWKSYDGAFKKTFGDGERTDGDDEDLLLTNKERKNARGPLRRMLSGIGKTECDTAV